MKVLYRLLFILPVTGMLCTIVSASELKQDRQDIFEQPPEMLSVSHAPEGYSSEEDDETALFRMGTASDEDLQFRIALMFGQGVTVKQSFPKCLYLLEKAAEKRHIGAAFLLGTIYLKGGTLLEDNHGEPQYGGLNVPDDFPFDSLRAFSFYLISGNGGDSLSRELCSVIKKQVLSSKEYKTDSKALFNALEKESSGGNALAKRLLAEMYNEGELVERNYDMAFALYKESAESGDAWGQYNIAKKYIEGLGVKQDFSEGFRWMKKAAEQNVSQAQFDLSGLYYKGDGIAADKQMGYVWLLVARKNGSKEAEKLLGKYGSGGLTAEEESTAREMADKILVLINTGSKQPEQMKIFS